MWVLIQHNEDNTRFKYVTSHDYNAIISYINKFTGVKKYSDYLFISNINKIIFEIKLGEDLDYYEKTSKKKEYNKKTFYNKEYRQIRKRNKEVS